MKEDRLILFVLESIIIQHDRYISEDFILDINDFIKDKYYENLELFSYIFNKEFMKDKIENMSEIISFEKIVCLIHKYRGFEGYLNLVDSVGHEIDSKINDLALLFNNYCIDTLDFYYTDEKEKKTKVYH